MKKAILTAFAAVAVMASPSFAQKEKEKDKTKDKEVQHIMITRSGDPNEKTVIEIVGDKVMVNGKEAKDNKDVTVKTTRIKDNHSYVFGQGRIGNNTWNMDMNGNNIILDSDNFSLFAADSNRAMLGVVTDSDDRGAKITEVSEGAAAEKAGLKAGDVITRIGDRKIEDAEDVSAAIKAHKPGQKVSIAYLRDGKEQKAEAELGRWKGLNISKFSSPRVMDEIRARPSVPQRAPNTVYGYGSSSPKLGLSIQDPEEGKGVKVIEVTEGTNAAKAGLKEKDVITHINEKEVNTTDEVTKIVRDNREKATLQFKVLRDGKVVNIEVRTPRKIKTADL